MKAIWTLACLSQLRNATCLLLVSSLMLQYLLADENGSSILQLPLAVSSWMSLMHSTYTALYKNGEVSSKKRDLFVEVDNVRCENKILEQRHLLRNAIYVILKTNFSNNAIC